MHCSYYWEAVRESDFNRILFFSLSLKEQNIKKNGMLKFFGCCLFVILYTIACKVTHIGSYLKVSMVN